MSKPGTFKKIKEVSVCDLPESQRLAVALSKCLKTGDVITFKGTLGAGKTEFCRSLIHALGYAEDVPSPTFNLVQIYEPPIEDQETPAVWHMDLYRLEEPEEIFELGIEEGFDTAISLIEWPDRMGKYLPQDHLKINLSVADDTDARSISFAGGKYWQQKLAVLEV